MNNKKRLFWINSVLVFALIAGLVLPAANVSAASKQKKTSKKVLVVYFSATGTTRGVAKKIKKASAKGAKMVKGKDLTDSSAKSVKNWAKKYVK